MEILFCIPGGGTSSLMYMGWQKLLKDEFTIIPLEIPGRGRLREMERASSLEEIAEGMARQVCEQANGRSYGIFGYCYGGILAYEICRILAEEGKCLPEDLYLCGTSAPFEEISVTPLLSRKEHRQDLKDMLSRFFPAYLTANTVVMEQLCEKYMEALFQKYDAEKQISDITEEDLNLEKLEDGEEKLLDYIVSFANDFFRSYSEDEALMLRYCKACSSPYCLDSRITVICGGDDRIAGQNGNCWKRCCRKEFIQHTIEGNHFTLIEDMEKIANGLELEDGEIHADAISYASEDDKSQVGIEIHSGRNRIVRRIFESLGYHVTKLDRVYFAGLTKKNLGRGKWRYLNEREVNALRMGAFE